MSSEIVVGTSHVPCRAPQMAWQRVDGELVLLAIDGKELIGLNEVAAHVWDLIDDEHAVAYIAQSVADAFAVDLDTAQRDVVSFVTDLARRGIVLVRTA